MNAQPVSLKATEDRALEMEWSDGVRLRYPFVKLRDNCPCATCREKKRAKAEKPKNILSILTAEETVPLTIMGMKPVGNYAYNITFSDGHSSGLFTIELLRSLGEPVAT
ncbi:MAG: DUF971 domain-containing protein, partial [Pirellula sp.]|jgi:DUF971 family protein|nr:DUF971 domain-containing protein [Pirellula sp.]